jgi:hypothetical protein
MLLRPEGSKVAWESASQACVSFRLAFLSLSGLGAAVVCLVRRFVLFLQGLWLVMVVCGRWMAGSVFIYVFQC